MRRRGTVRFMSWSACSAVSVDRLGLCVKLNTPASDAATLALETEASTIANPVELEHKADPVAAEVEETSIGGGMAGTAAVAMVATAERDGIVDVTGGADPAQIQPTHTRRIQSISTTHGPKVMRDCMHMDAPHGDTVGRTAPGASDTTILEEARSSARVSGVAAAVAGLGVAEGTVTNASGTAQTTRVAHQKHMNEFRVAKDTQHAVNRVPKGTNSTAKAARTGSNTAADDASAIACGGRHSSDSVAAVAAGAPSCPLTGAGLTWRPPKDVRATLPPRLPRPRKGRTIEAAAAFSVL
jgi:hypothetical protein